MTSFSSEEQGWPHAPDAAEIRRLNADMVKRLLHSAAQPVAEGGQGLRVLETRGRATGHPRRTPIGVVQRNDRLYAVSPDRRRDWVQNLTAHPGCRLLTGDDAHAFAAMPVHGDEAARVVGTYLAAVQAPWALQAFGVGADASHAQIAGHLDAIAVFQLESPADPADGSSSAGDRREPG